jgi:RsiW-degrading membrane proteinase PrsW (M82 family)
MCTGAEWFVLFIGIPTWFIVVLGVLIFRSTRISKRKKEENIEDFKLEKKDRKSPLKVLGETILIILLSILFSFGFAYLVVLNSLCK